MVLADAVKEATDSGIALAPSAQDRPCVGTITHVGSDCDGWEDVPLAVGDRVLYASWAGIEYVHEGQRWLVLAESDIVGVLTPMPDGAVV